MTSFTDELNVLFFNRLLFGYSTVSIRHNSKKRPIMENELLVNATNEFHLFVDHYKQTLPAALLYESVL